MLPTCKLLFLAVLVHLAIVSCFPRTPDASQGSVVAASQLQVLPPLWFRSSQAECFGTCQRFHPCTGVSVVHTDRPLNIECCVTLQITKMIQLQRAASDGVIELDIEKFDQLVVGKTRPYSLMFFLAADHLQDKPNLRLRELREEFGLVAKAFHKNHVNTSATGALGFRTALWLAHSGFPYTTEHEHEMGSMKSVL